MKNRYDIDKFYYDVTKNIEDAEKESFYPGYMYRAIYDGKNEFYQKEKVETKKFDDKWIRIIESYFPSINKITLNLKSALKYQSEVIPIEKAKKVNKSSIIHLMSHSNFVNEITEDGVIPKQILTILPEIEYGIYENRFIMTLIIRLREFLRKRVKLMQDELKASRSNHLHINSNFTFEESDIEMTVDIKQIDKIRQKKIDEENTLILKRAENLLKLVTRLNYSQFMKIMRRFKQVKPPIMKTQIILSNQDFKNAYLLWVYLDKYNELGFNSGIKTINRRFTDMYSRHLHQSLMLMCTTMLAQNKTNRASLPDQKATYKERKAKILTKLPLEIDPNPVAFEIEDTGLNEYYLNKNKQILKKEFTELLEEGSEYKVALKRALYQTTSITNGLYESFFKYNGPADVFSKLVIEDEDPQKMFKDAYKKYIIACTVREVKEQDYKRAISLERKWQKELKRLHKIRMETLEERINKEYNDIIEEIQKKYKDRLDVCISRNFSKKKEVMKNNQIAEDALKKRLSDEYREKKNKLISKAELHLATERKRLAEQFHKDKENEERNYREKMKKLRAEHKEKMESLEITYKEKYHKDVNRIKSEANDKLERRRLRYEKFTLIRKKRLQENIARYEARIKKIEQNKDAHLAKEYEERLASRKKNLQIRVENKLNKLRKLYNEMIIK